MSEKKAVDLLKQLNKANKLAKLSLKENGPRSYKEGQGAVVRLVAENPETNPRDMVEELGVTRKDVKASIKKAEDKGLLVFEDADGNRFRLVLTEEGEAVAAKREEAQQKAAEDVLACLTEEERAQLDAITEKIILAAREKGIDGKTCLRKSRKNNGKAACHHGRGHGSHGHHGHHDHHGHHGHGHGHRHGHGPGYGFGPGYGPVPGYGFECCGHRGYGHGRGYYC